MKRLNNKNSLLIYSLALTVVFYLLPLLFKGNIAFLFVVNPIAVLICSIIYGKNDKFNFIIVIITALLFLPSIYIFYNDSAWIYAVFYAIVSAIGCYIGFLKTKKNK